MGKRLKILLIYSVLLFIVSTIISTVLVLVLGSVTGIILSLPTILIVAVWISYKGAWALRNVTVNGKNTPATINGLVIVLLASLFTGILNYFLTRKFNLGPGLLGYVAGALGGYLVERKTKGTKLFGL